MPNKYGAQHKKLRRAWAQRIANGEYPPCSRCTYGIAPWDQWHLDHDDTGTVYLGPAHAHCNTAAGGRNHGAAHDKQQRNPRPASQAW